MPLNKNRLVVDAVVPIAPAAALLQGLELADPLLRRAAAQAMAGLTEAVPLLLQTLQHESVLSVRTALLESLAATPGDEAVHGLAGCLRSEDVWLRNTAIEMLRGIPEQVAPVIAHLLIDPDRDVRILAVSILDNLRHAQVEEWLLQLIDAETDVNVCGAALDVLTSVATGQASTAVQALMQRFAEEPYIQFSGKLLLERLAREQ